MKIINWDIILLSVFSVSLWAGILGWAIGFGFFDSFAACAIGGGIGACMALLITSDLDK